MTHTFKHPKYWREMRKERQAASLKQVINETVPWNEVVEAQASSSKPQATEIQASSGKPQAPSCKPQASSREQQAAQSRYPHKVSSS